MILISRKCENPKCSSIFKVSENCTDKYCCENCRYDTMTREHPCNKYFRIERNNLKFGKKREVMIEDIDQQDM